MDTKYFKLFCFTAIVWCISTISGLAQQKVGKDTTALILIENADNQVTEVKKDTVVRYFNGNVKAFHQENYIFCDNAVLKNNDLYATGNIVIIQNDTIKVFGDTLLYFGDRSLAYLSNRVILENGKDKLFTQNLEYKTDTKIAYYTDKGLMLSDSSVIKSKLGTYFVNEQKAVLKELVTVESPQFKMKTDSLNFYSGIQKSEWFSPALIVQDSSELYSKQGYYISTTKMAGFMGNAQYVSKDQSAVADTILYDGNLEKISLLGHARYVSKQDTAVADTIHHFRALDKTALYGHARYKGEKNEANGDVLIFDKKSGAFDLNGGGKIVDGSNVVEGKKIKYNTNTKVGKIVGTVMWQDTAAQTLLLCDSLDYDGSTSYFKAMAHTRRATLATLVDADTMWTVADTLWSHQVITKKDSLHSDTIKYLHAYHDVQIFKKDLQAVADSLTFNARDSFFTLYHQPIIWSDTSQITGDTIFIYLKNKTLDRLNVHDNALMLTSPDLIFFNQIKGKTFKTWFENKAIKTLNVDGNAQVVYYMIDDDDGYIGVNLTSCSNMVFNFEDKKVDNIKFYKEPTSFIKPIEGTDHEALKLKGFNWQISRRPADPVVMQRVKG